MSRINTASLGNFEQYEAKVLDAQDVLEARLRGSLLYEDTSRMSAVVLAVREKVSAVRGDEEDDEEEGDWEKVRMPKL